MTFPTYPFIGQFHIHDNTIWCWSGERWNSLATNVSQYEPQNLDQSDECEEDVRTILYRLELQLDAIHTHITSLTNNRYLIID